MSIVSELTAIQTDLEDFRVSSVNGAVIRELSIAITAVEDAIMRTNRAFAKDAGTFKVADVEQLVRDGG